MTDVNDTADEQRNLRTLKTIVGIGLAALAVSIASGVLLLALDPNAGSSTEATLGLIAAIGGLATGVFAIAALIYAQVKNLWGLVPTPLRVVLWVFIAAGVAVTLWNLLSQPFQN
jgi:hypothetical protein